jgi:hypothetical protein
VRKITFGQQYFPHRADRNCVASRCGAPLERAVILVAALDTPEQKKACTPDVSTPSLGVRQLDRYVWRRADHAGTTIGVAAAFESLQQKQEFLGEHLRILR